MKAEDINLKTKEAVNFLAQALESGQSEVLSQYLSAMAKFHTYSFGNILLIARQKPIASNVAGVRTWNTLGRFVKRGEKGIMILAPMVGRRNPDRNEVATEIKTDNAADERKPVAQLYGFRAVYVFDISQTEGKGLPTLTEVQVDVAWDSCSEGNLKTNGAQERRSWYHKGSERRAKTQKGLQRLARLYMDL